MAIVNINLSKLKPNSLNKLSYTLKNKSLEDYIISVIEEDLNSIIYFDYGFYYCYNKDKIFDNNNNPKNLSSIEYKLFKYLLKNNHIIISMDEIALNVWGHKDVSVFTIRNKIRNIRLLTYYNIISNYNKKGYKLNINKK